MYLHIKIFFLLSISTHVGVLGAIDVQKNTSLTNKSENTVECSKVSGGWDMSSTLNPKIEPHCHGDFIIDSISVAENKDGSIHLMMNIFNKEEADAVLEVRDSFGELVDFYLVPGHKPIPDSLQDLFVWNFVNVGKAANDAFTQYPYTDYRNWAHSRRMERFKLDVPAGGSIELTKTSTRAYGYNIITFALIAASSLQPFEGMDDSFLKNLIYVVGLETVDEFRNSVYTSDGINKDAVIKIIASVADALAESSDNLTIPAIQSSIKHSIKSANPVSNLLTATTISGKISNISISIVNLFNNYLSDPDRAIRYKNNNISNRYLADRNTLLQNDISANHPTQTSTSNPTFTEEEVKYFNGIWIGGLKTKNRKSSVRIEIDVSKGQQFVAYPKLDCGGKLLLKDKNKSSLTFIEIITFGKEKCTHAGEIQLSRISDKNMMLMLKAPTGKYTGYGKLDRTSSTIASLKISNDRSLVDKNILPSIAAGRLHSVVLNENGTVSTWGANRAGQLGDGTTGNHNKPVLVRDESGNVLSDIVAVFAGDLHTAALKSDGTVLGWGANTSGQLGDYTKINRMLPTAVGMRDVSGSALNGVIDIATGDKHTLALMANGMIYSWGSNGRGQLGDGTSVSRPYPALVLDATGNPLEKIIDIAAGMNHSVALKHDGTVLTWGDNSLNKLGYGNARKRINQYPRAVVNLGRKPLTGVVAITASDKHSLALKGDGTVVTWGANSINALTSRGLHLVKTSNTGKPLSGVVSVAAGRNYSLALKVDGTVVVWGHGYPSTINSDRDGNITIPRFPTLILAANGKPLSGVLAIAAGKNHAIVRKSDGTVLSWGDNRAGQLGNGTDIDQHNPVGIKNAALSPTSGLN